MSKQSDIDTFLYPEKIENRPKTVGECQSTRLPGKPCAYVGCRYNLYLDVTPYNTVTVPGHEPWDQPPERSCALEVAARGGMETADIAETMGISRQRVDQIIHLALLRVRIRVRKSKYELP
jgi:hypothetical protein